MPVKPSRGFATFLTSGSRTELSSKVSVQIVGACVDADFVYTPDVLRFGVILNGATHLPDMFCNQCSQNLKVHRNDRFLDAAYTLDGAIQTKKFLHMG